LVIATIRLSSHQYCDGLDLRKKCRSVADGCRFAAWLPQRVDAQQVLDSKPQQHRDLYRLLPRWRGPLPLFTLGRSLLFLPATAARQPSKKLGLR
jgi:hypothetical protein